MKKEITRLDVGSVAMMYGAILGTFGLVIGIFIALFGSLFGSLIDSEQSGMFVGGGVFMALLLPIMYGVLGLIAGALMAVVYNFLAGRIGGVKVYVRD